MFASPVFHGMGVHRVAWLELRHVDRVALEETASSASLVFGIASKPTVFCLWANGIRDARSPSVPIYTQREMEAAVAVSGDLHSHQLFEDYCERKQILEAPHCWQICIEAGVTLEAAAQKAGVEWGISHDFLIAVEALVEILVTRTDQDIESAVRQALAAAENRK